MQIRQIGVLGGSGFIGSAIVHRLSNAGYQVRVLTRRREASKHLILLPQVQVVECDITQDAELSRHLQGCDALINLIGIRFEDGKSTFQAMHVELPQRLAAICVQLDIRRVLHMSALRAADDAPSAYLRSKAAGEAALQQHARDLDLTIFRPSVVFGRGDSFLNMFASLLRYLPVVALASPQARFQPVYVEDVARAFTLALAHTDSYAQTYELGGPQVYTLRELVQLVASTIGVKRTVIGLGDGMSWLQAAMLELLPGKLMTRDNLASMQVDSVCNAGFPPIFGFQPTAVEAEVPDYLANDTPRASYDRFRSQAGR